MPYLNEQYLAQQFIAFQQSRRDEQYSVRCLLAALAYIGLPDTLIDVGCGSGHLVKLSRRLGIEAFGYDLNVEETEYLCRCDFRNDFHLITADVVVCWELAEHLPPQRAGYLCDQLRGAVRQGGCLLFSAATPQQGGSGHFNEQPKEYWIDKLTTVVTGNGLHYNAELTQKLGGAFSDVAAPCPWYGNNLIVLNA